MLTAIGIHHLQPSTESNDTDRHLPEISRRFVATLLELACLPKLSFERASLLNSLFGMVNALTEYEYFSSNLWTLRSLWLTACSPLRVTLLNSITNVGALLNNLVMYVMNEDMVQQAPTNSVPLWIVLENEPNEPSTNPTSATYQIMTLTTHAFERIMMTRGHRTSDDLFTMCRDSFALLQLASALIHASPLTPHEVLNSMNTPSESSPHHFIQMLTQACGKLPVACSTPTSTGTGTSVCASQRFGAHAILTMKLLQLTFATDNDTTPPNDMLQAPP